MVFVSLLGLATSVLSQVNVNCTRTDTIFLRGQPDKNIDSSTSLGTYCLTINEVDSNVDMLQLQTIVTYGNFDAFYRLRNPDSDWQPLSLETLDVPNNGVGNTFIFMPFTFGQTSLEVAFRYNASTAGTLNIGFAEFVTNEPTPTPAPSGSSSPYGSSSPPLTGTVLVVNLQRYYEYRIPISVNCPGKVTATATFDGNSQTVLIFLKGNGRGTFYEQNSGSSPVTLRYDVTESDLQASSLWQLWVTNWDTTRDARNVRVTYETPDCPTVPSGPVINASSAGRVQQLAVLNEHSAGVTSIAYSPDGTSFVSGSDDRTLILWDAATYAVLRRFSGHSDYIESVAFNHNGNRIVSASNDTTLILWNANNGNRIRDFVGHSGIVEGVAFSPNGRRILSGSSDGRMILWETQTGNIVRTFPMNSHVEGVAYSPAGDYVVSASLNHTAVIWNRRNGNSLHELSRHTDEVEAVDFTPGGNRLVTASADQTLIMWDTHSGEFLRQFRGHSASVEDVAFSPIGGFFASSSQDNTIMLWSVDNSNPLAVLRGHTARIDGLAFSPDGAFLVSASMDGTVRVWGVR